MTETNRKTGTPYIMRIKNPKSIDANGNRQKVLGYAQKVGGSLAASLRDHEIVQMVALGPGPANNLLKAICYAQRMLKMDGRNLIADEFEIKDVELASDNGDVRIGRALCITVRLI